MQVLHLCVNSVERDVSIVACAQRALQNRLAWETPTRFLSLFMTRSLGQGKKKQEGRVAYCFLGSNRIKDRVEAVFSLLPFPQMRECKDVWNIKGVNRTLLSLEIKHWPGPGVHPDFALHILQLIMEPLPQDILILHSKWHNQSVFGDLRSLL